MTTEIETILRRDLATIAAERAALDERERRAIAALAGALGITATKLRKQLRGEAAAAPPTVPPLPDAGPAVAQCVCGATFNADAVPQDMLHPHPFGKPPGLVEMVPGAEVQP